MLASYDAFHRPQLYFGRVQYHRFLQMASQYLMLAILDIGEHGMCVVMEASIIVADYVSHQRNELQHAPFLLGMECSRSRIKRLDLSG